MARIHGQADDGDRRWPEGVVTLLLTDVEGSTRAWEAHPEAMSAALARHDELIADVVNAHRGLLIKSRGEGDATFSVFPRASDAALAAVAVQRAIAAEPWPDATPLSIRVALHTGEAQLRDGDYFGIAVNRAARLRAVAAGGEILCSQATAGIIADTLPADATLTDRGAQALKDLSRPEQVFSLYAPGMVKPVRATGAASRRRARPFVGRAREVEVATECLADAQSGHGGALLVAGEPGIGKTRLAEVVESRAQSLGVPVIWGRCLEEEGTPAFWPWRQVLRACLDDSVGGDIAAQLGADAGDLAILIPEFGRRDDERADAPIATPPGGEARFRVFEAVTRALVLSAKPAGLVIVLDDFQWADPSSALLLAHLGRDLGPSRLLVVVTYRDREVGSADPVGSALASLARERGTARVRLEGLAEVEVADQLEATFGRRFGVDVVAGVARRTQGNPFFVGEIGVLLDATGRTSGLTAEAWETDLPEGVRALITQRLRRLSPACCEVLRTAAVVGASNNVEMLAAVCESPTTGVLAELDVASEAGLVAASDDGRSVEFSHALVRDTLQAEVPSPRRLEIHRRVAEHIEATHPNDLDRYAAQLAHHWLSALPAVDAQIAVEWAQRAAAAALADFAYEEAARLYRRALDVVDSGGFATEDRCRLLLQLAEARYKSGDIGLAIVAASEAGDAATRCGDAVAMARAALVLEGVSDEAWGRRVVELCEHAIAGLGDDHPDLRSRAMAATAAVYSFTLADEGPSRAEALSREALALAETTRAPDAIASSLRARQMALAGPDGVGERLEVAERMLALAAETADPWAALWGRLWRIEAQCQLGEVAAAETELAPLARTVELLRQPVADWHLARTRCSLAMGRGRFAEASHYLDEAVALGRLGIDARGRMMHSIIGSKLDALTGDPRYEAALVSLASEDAPGSVMAASTILALSYAEKGQLDRARDQYRRLPPLAGWRVPPFVALVALDQRARAAAILGDIDGATYAYERLGRWAAYFVVGGTGLVAMHGSVEYTLGRLATSLGKTDAAIRHLRAAVAANGRAGLLPFEVESRCELAAVLARRARREDLSEAIVLAGDVALAAARLGMSPAQARAEDLVESLRHSGKSGGPAGLTRREREIAALVARGLTNRQIADALHVAERTAENHVQHILTKLGLQNRTQIAAWASSGELGDATTS